MVIVDDGEQDLAEAISEIPASQLRYFKLDYHKDYTLGELRNCTLEEATGDFLIQWDDDDWYHPERISVQSRALQEGYDACCLSGALMHLNEEPYLNHPYVGVLPDGIPGSIMHRAESEIRYPHTRRAEDTVYLNKWMEKRYLRLPGQYSYLFIRCYHGSNTWERKHFLRRIRNNPKDAILYFWHKVIRGELFDHPSFQLTSKEKESFKLYLEDSQESELLPYSITE